MTHPRIVLGVLMAAMLVTSSILAACQPATPAATPVPTKAAGTPAPSGVPADLAGPQELRVNLVSEPPTLDPNTSRWSTANVVIEMLFEGLLRLEPDAQGNLIPKAAIAREVPSRANGGISADGKTYTFKLRDGMKYSDGKPVKAQDIEYSVKRLFDPALAASYASFYFDIKGAKDYYTAKGTQAAPKTPSEAELKQLRDAVGVKAKDDLTVEFTLAQPRATFLQLAAMWPIFPLRQDIIEAKADKWIEAGNLVGNGPFKLTEWEHKDHITLAANENYYGTKPHLQKITMRMIGDLNAAFAAYQAGELDIVAPPAPSTNLIRNDANLKPQIVQYPRLVTFAFQFNHSKAPFDNVKVRQAFSTAIDREAFVDKVNQGIGKTAYSWIPPGMPGHQADLGKAFKVDPTKAKQLLADAGFPDGKGLPQVSFRFADTANNRLYAEFLQGQLKDNLGIEIKLDGMESKAYTDAFDRGDWQIAWTGWGADYPDPDNWLPELFGTGAGHNDAKYSNKEFDDLVAKAMAETDSAKQLQLWNDAQKRIVDDAVLAWIIFSERFNLKKPYVKGMITTGMDRQIAGDRFFDKLYLSKK